MKKIYFLFLLGILFAQISFAQFANQVPNDGGNAISKDSLIIQEWATECTSVRGWKDIAHKDEGTVSGGVDSYAIGKPTVNTRALSLGDSGMATVTFEHLIFNGDGPDFAVFENGFLQSNSDSAFLELGFVEVSSDGVHFVRFPATSHIQDSVQIGTFGFSNASEINNLAGKYIFGYGTPFDLAELADSPNIDINQIKYVRVVDAIGSISDSIHTTDQYGHIINDPYPTNFNSGGFDLTGVGVIHPVLPTSTHNLSQATISIFPNPNNGQFKFSGLVNSLSMLEVFDLSGKKVYTAHFYPNNYVNLGKLINGNYFYRLSQLNKTYTGSFILLNE